ncbi:MAG: type II CRISPR RNA-guided endonuclease Cas9 [Bacteroidales bacterium]|nr:type II CRISPR RNA-guided endonuclease Cas9 [Bacteroidales bacterium]
MKKILGLDLGTNSIGWAVVNAETIDEETKLTNIESAGSRIIPMDAGTLGNFEKGQGNSKSKAAERTEFRGRRRLLERFKLRRERLNRVLNIMGFLPEHYSSALNRYGQFIDYQEPKLPWVKDENDKSIFLFEESFLEMCEDFKHSQPNLKNIPKDWTIYYIRKKALSQAISKQELAWILLQFNQKRGYYQFREEENAKKSKNVSYCESKILNIESSPEGKNKYIISLENGTTGLMESKTPLNWEGRIREFIVTKKVDKEGNETILLREPSPKNDKDIIWESQKVQTENFLVANGVCKHIGEYIYDELLKNPDQKIIGKFIQVVERKYYKQELIQILNKQKELGTIAELNDTKLLNECINALYPNNETHQHILKQKDFTNLFVKDILFYQRPLKSKKSLIADCPYEVRVYKNKKDNRIITEPLKCVAKSHPLFQEFRLWQFIQNLRIYKREEKIEGVLKTNYDITAEYLNNEDAITNLFEFLNQKKEIGQKELLKHFKLKDTDYRWNYVEDKKYPCNTTYASLLSRIKKVGLSEDFLTKEIEEHLWHILYSISSKEEIGKALRTFAEKYSIEDKETFAEELQKEIFPKNYASYSLKAIKKLLPIMRLGKYWSEEAIDSNTKERIEKILTGEVDETINDKTRKELQSLTDISQFQGFPLWLTCYVVYGRHSEAKEITKWESPKDIDKYLKQFKQHSLRNPIVEQIVTETLRTVRDIWNQVGRIDEIHLELGRELKNSKEKKDSISKRNTANENTNLRIRKILKELSIEYSISRLNKFKIYEDFALNNLKEDDKDYEFIDKMMQNNEPTKSDIERYKAWLEQKYQSPYTGKPIPLSKLFTDAYQIEHIIPRAIYFDDSFDNKVICEAEVNNEKNKMLGYEFISKRGGEVVTLTGGESVTLFTLENYEKFVNEHYSKESQKYKRINLLRTEVPDEFTHRQSNDSRYISRFVMSLLSNIVREKREDGTFEEEATSKNLIPCTGGTTTRLKADWGMNDVWDKIILPRFQRLNVLTNLEDSNETKKDSFTIVKNGKEIPIVPDDLLKGFEKKRIDHRHHAMDAIVIACTTRSRISLINNENAAEAGKNKEAKDARHKLQSKLRHKKAVKLQTGETIHVYDKFKKPWDTFTQDAEKVLRDIVVSFKQNLRVVTKATNTTKYKEGKKTKTQKQVKGDLLAIRKPLHAETVYGEVNLNLGKNTNDRYCATRKAISDIVSKKGIASITDTGIQKILKEHLKANDGNIEKAFSREGFEDMNRNIQKLNDNKPHKPIYKARQFESSKEKFAVGTKGNKSQKFVETAKGTNLFFAVYELENGKRTYATVPLNIVIDCQKTKQKEWKSYLDEMLKEKRVVKNKNAKLLFIISPNDLVYLPTQEELKTKQYSYCRERIYKLVSCDRTTASFIPATFATSIFSMSTQDQKKKYNEPIYKIQDEIGISEHKSKSEKSLTYKGGEQGEVIKETCIPIKVDRLGNIIS